MKDIIGFLKKGGPRWPFRFKAPTSASFSIGPYHLDMQMAGLSSLREFSKIEYRKVIRQFKGERFYYGPDVDFLGYPWKMILNIVNGQIYKMTASIETQDKDSANGVVMDAFLYCKSQMGEPTQQRREMFIWRTMDGDVALQTTQTTEGFGINLVLTSHAIRDFSRLR